MHIITDIIWELSLNPKARRNCMWVWMRNFISHTHSHIVTHNFLFITTATKKTCRSICVKSAMIHFWNDGCVDAFCDRINNNTSLSKWWKCENMGSTVMKFLSNKVEFLSNNWLFLWFFALLRKMFGTPPSPLYTYWIRRISLRWAEKLRNLELGCMFMQEKRAYK